MIILNSALEKKHDKPKRRWQQKCRMRRISTTTSLNLLFSCVVPVTFVTLHTATIVSFIATSPYYNPYYRFKHHHHHQNSYARSKSLKASGNAETPPPEAATYTEEDSSLVDSVTLDQLTKLCDQCFVSYGDVVNENQNESIGDKDNSQEIKLQLINRLRNHANTQAEIERQRRLARKMKVENNNNEFTTAFDESTYNPKERYEVIESNDYYDENDFDDSSDEGFFFFDLPTISDDLRQAQIQSNSIQKNTNSKQNVTSTVSSFLTSDQVTSPPPPIEPNANGERVVKIYSTTQLNDLTSIAASQPGQNAMISSLDSTLHRADGKHSESQPWDFSEQQQYASSNNNQPYIEKAKEQLTELVSTLLAMSGVPGFATPDGYLGNEDDNNDASDEESGEFRPYQANSKRQNPSSRQGVGGVSSGARTNVNFISNGERVGFNPVNVPVELLASSSKAIRACRGEVLDEVLRQYEIQGIGYDGAAGDNVASGGGHYREAIKVRAFLEGYRRAEVRRLARETSSMLLNKIMLEGIDALDLTLNTMIRSNDDTEEYGGTQLNDSLLDFLNDAIRQKEKEVEARNGDLKLDGNGAVKTWTDQLTLHDNILGQLDDENDYDDLDHYWNITEVDGQRIETFDPNNEEVKIIVKKKLDKMQQQGSLSSRNTMDIPETAPEQVLLLLKLLRERIKTEAAFSYDEKGRNLRLLAYCIHADTDDECEQYILKQLGTSLDRLDSFIELVTSSIEYSESTSYELQPATTTKTKLDVLQLRQILNIAVELRTRQSIKASGVRQSK